METNEIRMDEVIDMVTEGAESVIDAAAEGAKDTANMYILAAFAVGAGIAVAANAAWKYAIKPGIGKLKELKKKHDEDELESYIEITEGTDEKESDNEAEDKDEK